MTILEGSSLSNAPPTPAHSKGERAFSHRPGFLRPRDSAKRRPRPGGGSAGTAAEPDRRQVTTERGGVHMLYSITGL